MRTGTTVIAVVGLLLATGPGPATAAGALTGPEAQAIAAGGIVHAGDLPRDYFSPPRTSVEPDRSAEVEFYGCLGSRQPEYLARNVGPTFLYAESLGTPQAKSVSVASTADVATEQEAATADQQNLRTAKAARCYRKRLDSQLRAQRVQPKGLSVTLVRAAVPGADEAWAYRYAFTASNRGTEVSRAGFVVGARVGQALLSVSYTVSGQQVTLATVTELAAKPVARVQRAATGRRDRAA